MADQTTPVSDPNPDNKEAPVGGTLLLDGKAPSPTLEAKPAAPAPEPVKPEATEAVEYEPTGDAGLDLALQFIGKAGIQHDHPALVAASNGDFSILKATLAGRNIPGWEQYVALGEQAYQRNAEASKAAAAATLAAAEQIAGGADEWKAIQAWASANATPQEKAEINALLNAGGVKAKSAVVYLAGLYNKSNPERTPEDPTANAGRGGSFSANGPLSPSDYVKEVNALNVKLRGRVDGSPEYAALQRRRAAYRG